MVQTAFQIEPLQSDRDYAATIQLFQDYANSLEIDLDFQDFSAELASFPGKYSPPSGKILLARNQGGEILGCVALRPMVAAGCCEMKRLWVAPKGRGFGLGKELVIAIIKEAERIGYKTMMLDTLPSMAFAIHLYRSEGFTDIGPYYKTPIPDTVFLQRSLEPR